MIGIIGAMEDEVIMLRRAMTEVKSVPARPGNFEFIQGNLEGKPAVLLRCGIGKVNAAVGCALLIERYRPEAVINTGSAGGIDSALGFGDAIISDGLVYHDADVVSSGYAPGQIPGMPAVFTVPEDLIRRAEQAVDELVGEGLLPKTFRHVRGLIGSADVFMDTEEKITRVRRIFPHIRAVEMEGAAVAHTCFLFSVPALIIRAVSDIAGAESPMKFDEFLPIASKHSGEIVRRIIRNWQEKQQLD
ncbi:MAG: 5'-methylthioadenosine/S-adenosylhomocysteine nucleosidase [Treponema sp.]|jgi:adenosylhomocysteine nucleosidase|nr:5'-methylthioadenosine/S-adenosylhomocysteine nucleosidase [Treponema sp.]